MKFLGARMIWDRGEKGDCPICGYPTKGSYYGIYEKGSPCGKCGYVDVIAAAKLATKDHESKERIKRNKENPPIFKSVEDWEKYQ
jgi:hypothetical protein